LRVAGSLAKQPTIEATAGWARVSKGFKGGAMKPVKKQPTRDDLAAAWKTIRDQTQIIKLQAEAIRRQDQVLGNVLMAYPRFEELRVN
jgi:hypothetical protein